MHESARADVIFVAFWSSCSNIFVCVEKWVLSQLRIAITPRGRFSWHSNAQRQLNPVAHLLFLLFLIMVSGTNITRNGSFRGVGAREIIKAFWKRTSFSLVCMNVLHQMDKKGVVFHECSKSGWMSTSGNIPVVTAVIMGCISTSSNFPVFTAVIKLSAFADAFVKQSDKLFWVEIWAKSWILPGTGFLSQHRNHVNRLLLFR